MLWYPETQWQRQKILQDRARKLYLEAGKYFVYFNITVNKNNFNVYSSLRFENESVLISKNGILLKRKPNIFYVDSYQKRYIPAKGDSVVGIVQSKTLDYFWVDINASETAALSYMAFEGATKKNRPEVSVGDTVYCKLLLLTLQWNMF